MRFSFALQFRNLSRPGTIIGRLDVLKLLHAHFGDRMIGARGRLPQIQRLLDPAADVHLEPPARRLLQRALELAPLLLPFRHPQESVLRRADLLLATTGGLRSVLSLPANGGRLVALFLNGLDARSALQWVEQGAGPVDRLVFLGPEELELGDLVALARIWADALPVVARPRLCIVPQGRLEPQKSHWLAPEAGESLLRLSSESGEACSRLLGISALAAGELWIRATFTGGLALSNALRESPTLNVSRLELEDALYGELPERLIRMVRANPSAIELFVDVLPHQRDAVLRLRSALPGASVQVRIRRPVERVRQLEAVHWASGR